MCKCINVPLGSNANQSSLHAPDGKLIGIDNCILDEIKTLWSLEIVTIESCCGHNVTDGYIAVNEKSIWKMRAMGYKNYDHHRPEIFYSKSCTYTRY